MTEVAERSKATMGVNSPIKRVAGQLKTTASVGSNPTFRPTITQLR